MIDYKSLRLNNWILDRGIPTQVSMLSIGVTFYSINGVNLDKKTGRELVVRVNPNPRIPDESCVSDEDRFSGIELTPEILEACGLLQHTDNLYFINTSEGDYLDTLLIQKDSGWWWRIDSSPSDEEEEYGSKWRELKSLHQLQSVYYWMAETELSYHPSTISEKTE